MFRKKLQKPRKRNYAFIDSQNLNLGVQKFGWKLDWRKFREYLRVNYDVEKAFLFIGYLPENEDLYTQMHDAGYAVVLKPTIDMLRAENKDEKGQTDEKKPATKGNTDADMVLYAMKELPNYHQAVIVSGDGDFYGLIEYLATQNRLLKMLAPNMFYSSLLKPFEQYIVRVDSFKNDVVYRPAYRKKSQNTRSSGRRAPRAKK